MKNINDINPANVINYKPDITIDKLPIYPTAAKRMGQQGTVKLEINTDIYGEIISIAVIRSSGYPLLDESSIEAVKEWNYKRIIDERSVSNKIITQFNFELE